MMEAVMKGAKTLNTFHTDQYKSHGIKMSRLQKTLMLAKSQTTSTKH
jgi:hypothetical protein